MDEFLLNNAILDDINKRYVENRKVKETFSLKKCNKYSNLLSIKYY